MAETVVVRQNKNFEIEFQAADPHQEDQSTLNPVVHIYELTPYGMLLASMGSCTTILLHSYAQNHNIPLEWVEIRLTYDREFDEDCKNCEKIDRYEDVIYEELKFTGPLNLSDHQKLLVIAEQCPIHKMVTHPTRTELRLAEPET